MSYYSYTSDIIIWGSRLKATRDSTFLQLLVNLYFKIHKLKKKCMWDERDYCHHLGDKLHSPTAK